MNLIFSILSTLFIIFIVPILVYGSFVSLFKIKEPEKKLKFFLGVLIEKVGTAFCFVLIFNLGKDVFIHKWFVYGLIWLLMFALVEIGQVYRTGSSRKEAVAGIISEAIYFPLVAFVISILLR